MSACEKGPASKVPLFLLLKEMEKKKKKKKRQENQNISLQLLEKVLN